MVKAKVTTEELCAAYLELGSVHKVAERFGMCGQSVHERLINASFDQWKKPKWTAAETARLIEEYDRYAKDGALDRLAFAMGRSLGAVTNQAKRLGLQERNRAKSYMRGNTNLAHHIATHGHPKGMSGKRHSAASKARMAKIHADRWAAMTPAEKELLAARQLEGRMASSSLTSSAADDRKSWQAGWRVVDGQRRYFRSKWEANYARYLGWLRAKGKIRSWEHEPKTFWFEGIRRGVCSYKPDFRVEEAHGFIAWHEVKGWMDDRSRVAIKRFAKYFPDERLIVIDAKAYRAIKAQVSGMIEGWE